MTLPERQSPTQLLMNASADDDCGQSVHSVERQVTDRWAAERLKATVLLCGPQFPVPPPKRLRGRMFGVQQIGIQCQAVERHVIPFNSVPGHHVFNGLAKIVKALSSSESPFTVGGADTSARSSHGWKSLNCKRFSTNNALQQSAVFHRFCALTV